MWMNSTLLATFVGWSSQFSASKKSPRLSNSLRDCRERPQVQDRVDQQADQMAQPSEHPSPQAGGGRPVTDSDTAHGAVPVLAARIALRRASSRAAHKGLLGR